MSSTKKRKSDVHVNPVENHPHTKKEKWYHEENQPPPVQESRRRFSLSGVIKKFKSSSALKVNKPAQDPISEYEVSINSESSVTSVESCNQSLLPGCEKNVGLRTFVNRDSMTPVPPDEQQLPSSISLPHIGLTKRAILKENEENSISVNSHMSVETTGSTHNIDEEPMSTSSASIFCTPARLPFARAGHLRLSTRSVDPRMLDESEDPLLLRSLCNSVRRAPSTKSDSGSMLINNALRRSLRNNTRRLLNASNMEDVPEDEPLSTVGYDTSMRNRHVFATSEADEEEKFEEGKTFFDKNLTSSTEHMGPEEDFHNSSILSQQSQSAKSENKITPGTGSIGRSSSFFRKVFPNKNSKERRCSEIGNEAIDAAMLDKRRSSIISFTGDVSMGEIVNNSDVNQFGAANSSTLIPKPKMRKKTHSSSNLTTRLSSVFRRTSNSSHKEDEMFSSFTHNRSNRRSTLTGYSSTSSGIGSVAGSEYGNIGNGTSVSRNGSKRDNDAKKEKVRRILDRIVISDIPACELLSMKMEQKKKKGAADENEKLETQLNESVCSTSSTLNELLNFDIIAVDVYPNGTPYSDTSRVVINENLTKQIAGEVRNQISAGAAGTIFGCEPDIIFVQHCPGTVGKDLNETVSMISDLRPEFLPNVRNGVMKAIEEWNRAFPHGNSTLLLYPLFCTCDEEWDSKDTIDSIFSMLDALVNAKSKWKAERKCILAGLTPKNVKLLKDKYEEMALFIADTDDISLINKKTSNEPGDIVITKV